MIFYMCPGAVKVAVQVLGRADAQPRFQVRATVKSSTSNDCGMASVTALERSSLEMETLPRRPTTKPMSSAEEEELGQLAQPSSSSLSFMMNDVSETPLPATEQEATGRMSDHEGLNAVEALPPTDQYVSRFVPR